MLRWRSYTTLKVQATDTESKCFLFVCLLFFFWLYLYIEVLDPCGAEFCVGWKIKFLSHSATCWYPSFSASFVEQYVFSLVSNCLVSLSKSGSYSHIDVYVVHLFYSIGLQVCYVPVSYWFYCYGDMIISSVKFLLFRIMLTILGVHSVTEKKWISNISIHLEYMTLYTPI